MNPIPGRKRGTISAAPRVLPPHFWPGPLPRAGHKFGLPIFPPGARFPCGTIARHPTRVTSNPLEVRCRRCLASELVQALLAGGTTEPNFSPDALRAWRLLPR